MNPRIEELLIVASDSAEPAVLDSLLAELRKADFAAKELRDGLSMMIDSWSGSMEPRRRAEFLIEISAFFNDDFAPLRSVLPKALRTLLPPDIEPASVVNALGIRDERIPPSLVHTRIRKFWHLAAGNYFFQETSSQWGKIESVDWISDVVRLAFINSSRRLEAGVATILDSLVLFRNEGKFKTLFQEISALKPHPPSSDVCREAFNGYVCGTPPAEIIKKSISILLVPAAMTLPAFDKWWDTTDKAGATPLRPRSEYMVEDARSLQELSILLKDSSKKRPKTPESLVRVARVLNLLKKESLPKDYVLWAENICAIAKDLSAEELSALITSCAKSFDFAVPSDPAAARPPQIKIWESLKTGILSTWARCVAAEGARSSCRV